MKRRYLAWLFVPWIAAPHPFVGQTIPLLELFPIADATISEGSPNDNAGTSVLRIRADRPSERALIDFDSESIRLAFQNVSLVSAKLQLPIQFLSLLKSEVVSLHAMQVGWVEAGVTWNCPNDLKIKNPHPNCGVLWNGGSFDLEPRGSAILDPSSALIGLPLEFDVTSDIVAIAAGGESSGWLIKFANEQASTVIGVPIEDPIEAWFASRETFGVSGPRLVLEFEAPGTDMAPPQIQIASPSSKTTLSSGLTQIELQIADGGSGIDPDSLLVLLAPLDVVADCEVVASQAHCSMPELAEGPQLLVASVSDLAGNQAIESFEFLLLDEVGKASAVLPATADSVIEEDSLNLNQGMSLELEVNSSAPARSLVRFDQTQIDDQLSEGPLLSAILEFSIGSNGANWGPEGRLLAAHRLTEDWSEASVTWNCSQDSDLSNQSADCGALWSGGGFAPTQTDSFLLKNEQQDKVQFDVTEDVQSFLLGTPNFGWLIKKSEELLSGNVEFPSRESGSDGPRLVLFFETAVAGDAIPPIVTIVRPAGPLIDQAESAIEASYTDEGAGVDLQSVNIRLGGVDITASCSVGASNAMCSPAPLAAGEHQLEVSVSDLVGNVGASSLDFEMNRIAIDLSILSPAEAFLTSEQSVVVSGTVDPAATDVSVDGLAAQLADGSFSVAVPLGEGLNAVTVVASDAFGNTGSQVVHVLRDTTPPSLTVLSPSGDSVFDRTSITISGSVNDLVAGTVNQEDVQVTVVGMPAQVSNRCFAASDVPLSPGLNSIAIQATDRAGNSSTTIKTLTLESSAGRPHVEMVSGDSQSALIEAELPRPAAGRERFAGRWRGRRLRGVGKQRLADDRQRRLSSICDRLDGRTG